MSKMFGERIHQFVLSCDIMDLELFHDILELISSYLVDEFKISCLSVLGKGKVNGGPGLKTVWSTSVDDHAYSIKRQTVENIDKYTSFSGYTFDKSIPLWIVGPSDSSQAEPKYKDIWNNVDLNKFNLLKGMFKNLKKPQTLVIHPLSEDGHNTGVMEFTIDRLFVPTATTRKEIKLLADVISRAYQMYNVRKMYRTDTKKAIRMLEESRKQETWAHLGRPKLFFAFSGGTGLESNVQNHHKIIIENIDDVLKKFENALEITRWDKMDKPGNIMSDLIETVVRSDYGIAYFSEPSGENEGQFQDNSNVLFEAGMMQALTNTPGVRFNAWIPIREEDQPGVTPPFDIAGERTVYVERSGEDRNLNSEAFKEKLHSVIQSLLDKED